MRKDQDRTVRRLTHDELKAAEAAFQGRPFNESWSQAAWTVYDGIVAAMIGLDREPFGLELPAWNREPEGARELVGVVASRGNDEGFNA